MPSRCLLATAANALPAPAIADPRPSLDDDWLDERPVDEAMPMLFRLAVEAGR